VYFLLTSAALCCCLYLVFIVLSSAPLCKGVTCQRATWQLLAWSGVSHNNAGRCVPEPLDSMSRHWQYVPYQLWLMQQMYIKTQLTTQPLMRRLPTHMDAAGGHMALITV
jgi:hypothetical protein